MLRDGWYLMSTEALMRELARFRAGDDGEPEEDVQALSAAEALAFRNAGNLPDATGRTLRLVLRVTTQDELLSLDDRRLEFEPDYLDAPEWRRAGSKPVNVVPLRDGDVSGVERAWWDDQELAPLEREWQSHGTIAGLKVPGEWRSFIFKTVVALRAAGREITQQAVIDGVARWLSPEQIEELTEAFRRAESD